MPHEALPLSLQQSEVHEVFGLGEAECATQACG